MGDECRGARDFAEWRRTRLMIESWVVWLLARWR